MEYDFDGYWQIVRDLQPNAVMFSDVGPDVRWVGNEKGYAGETCWSTINVSAENAPGKMSPAYLNTGDPEGTLWIPAETDVSIRPGWFYHEEEDDKVKSGTSYYYKRPFRTSSISPPDLWPEQVRQVEEDIPGAINSTADDGIRGNVTC